jgi:branched-chain amino acid transport system substrate-binding protein
LVAAVATGPQLRSQLNPYTFYVRPGNAEEIKAIIDHTAIMNIKRVGIVYADAPYGEEGFIAAKNILANQQQDLVGIAKIKLNGEDAEQAVRSLMNDNPQAVIMITVPGSSKAFITAAKRLGLKSSFYSLNAGLPIGSMAELGESARGVIVTQIMPNVALRRISVVREYQDDYKAAGHTKFTSASLEGYINAKVMVEALKRSGKQLSREKLVQTLEGMQNVDVGGYKVNYSKTNHSGSHQIEVSISSAEGDRFIY